ncbi:39S ribosomal protein L14, mitochondrial isoform X1 [Colletes gigas]|uniref:39S ribosomal protein L14, mitochondrial isoform X1 n=2 Tax=Colletes gigas TaxID=935657 RepID=UPI001C9A4DEF|nr:39S ribosomal protein L14, mitochondrial isoform X1 [Colletes gigas]
MPKQRSKENVAAMSVCPVPFNILSRSVSTSTISNQIIKLTRLRVVDNSEIGKQAMLEGKPPRCIHVYNKKGVGLIGDRVLVAIKGEKKKGILVGLKKHQNAKVPKFDSNNLVLIDDNGTPLGTRIHVPIPHILRTMMKEKSYAKGADYTKLLAIASKFV